MPPIDDKVVAMSFESTKFVAGIDSSIAALEKLKASLKFPDSAKGLSGLTASANKVDLGHISKGVDSIADKLGALRLVAIAVFAQIAQKALAAGTSLVKSFTIDPMKAGFAEYSTNLNSIQTILANTQASGAGLKEVNAALDELNDYSDKTIYNFGQMARNIGTFTAAGVDLKTATASIKGIANLAALSGSSAEQASTAMYQLSQAISSGSVKLMDWNSVVNAGMGGTVFQRALAMTGENMGKLTKGTVELVGPMKNVKIAGESFRNSLSAPGKDGWLTSDVLTTTLKMLTGDMTDAELAADGWNKSQIKAIQAQAKTAMLAATNVKTLSQVLSVAKETAGSGWAKTWRIIFGDFEEAKKTFTALSNAINGVLIDSARARNNVLGDWKALGGRTALIDAIKVAFTNLGLIIKPIKEAFRDIFPAKTAADLMYLTQRFEKFAAALKPGPETIENLKRTFRGLFAILDIGKQIVTGIFTVFGKIFQAFRGESGGGILGFTASIGDFFVSVNKWLKEGNRLQIFFSKLGTAFQAPVNAIGALGNALKNLFSGGSTKKISGSTQVLGGFQKVLSSFTNTFKKFVETMTGSSINLQPVTDFFSNFLNQLGPALGEAAANLKFEPILAVIRTGLLAGMFLMFKRFLGKGAFTTQLGNELGKNVNTATLGIVKNINGSFTALQGNLVAMQQNVKSQTLKQIAIAVALLAGSMVALSLIDPKKLVSALAAMTVAFADLIGAMALLTIITKSTGFIKLPFIAASLIFLAIAIDFLSIAVLALSSLSWEELAKGLGGVAGLLVIISAASVPLSAHSGGMIQAGIGITAMAIGLKILASVMKDFAEMSWTEIGKGLIGVAAGLGLMAVAMKAMPIVSMIPIGIGLIAVGIGLKIIANVMSDFANMDWKSLVKGLVGLGGSLAAIALAMGLMPLSMVFTSANLIFVAFALKQIVGVVKSLAGMSIKDLATGIGALGAALGVLALGLYAMSGTMFGATSLSVAAVGIALLVPSLKILGKMSWSSIAKGLAVLGGSLAIIGLAGVLLTPAIPALLGLGIAVVLIGGGLALAGAGLALFAAALSSLAISLPIGMGIMIAAVEEFQAAIPRMARNFIIGILGIVTFLAEIAPTFIKPLIAMLAAAVQLIIRAIPKIVEIFGYLVKAAAEAIAEHAPTIIQAGMDLLIALLTGIRNNISQIVVLVSEIITKFMVALTGKLGEIITAGANLLVAFLKGIANNLGKVVAAVFGIITRFITEVGKGLIGVPLAGLKLLTTFLSGISNNLGKMVKTVFDIITKFITEVGKGGERIITAGTNAMIKFINGLGKNSVELADAGAKAIINFLNGVADTIEKREPQIMAAGFRIGWALIKGFILGLWSMAQQAYNKAAEIVDNVLNIWRKLPLIGSPSKVTTDIGKYLVLGLIKGLDDTAPKAYASAMIVSKGVIDAFNTTFQTSSPSKVMMEIGKFVGQGFAQGLRGSKDDITGAFGELNTKLTEAMTTARTTIDTEQKKLDELRKASKPNAAAITAAQKVIAENQTILAQASAAHKVLVKDLKDEEQQLLALTGRFQIVTDKLRAAKDKLVEVTRQRDEITGQYSTLPSITMTDAEGNPVDAVAMYQEALRNQVDAVAAYNATLEQLRKLGINKTLYEKLVTDGTADQAFASQLLAGGKTAVNSLNTLDTQLATTSKRLATNAAANLFKGGVEGAEGLVRGLQSQHDEIRKEMEEIARMMLRALRKELNSKSPSQAFAEIGKDSMVGLAQGILGSSKIVTASITSAAKDALSVMRQSMRNISDIVTNELNPNPVITPILDLTQIQNGSAKLANMMKVVPITAAASYGQASRISSEQTRTQDEQIAASSGGTSITYEQNNYSPKALTAIEIYRQTHNQLSQTKSALGLT